MHRFFLLLVVALALDGVNAAAAVTPPHDDIANAIEITSYPFADALEVSELTRSSHDPVRCPDDRWTTTSTDKTAWYKLVPSVSERVSFDADGAGMYVGLDLFTGNPSSLVRVACLRAQYEERLRFDVTPGTTYYLLVSVPAHWTAVMSVSGDIAPPWPPNDDFDDAIEIDSPAFTHTIDATEAIDSLDDPPCIAWSWGYPARTVWYRWTAPGNRRVRIQTNGSAYRPALSVFTGPRGALTQIGDCEHQGEFPALEFDAAAGQTYHIMVGTFRQQDGVGELKLAFSAKAAATLTLGTSATRIRYGQSVRLSGRLTAVSELSGQKISIFRTRPGRPGRTLAGTAAVDADGNFSLVASPERTFAYQAEWGGSAESFAARSTLTVVEVRVRISGRMHGYGGNVGQYRIYGPAASPIYEVVVTPPHRGRHVEFRLQRQRNGRWRTIAAAALPLNKSGRVGVVLNRSFLKTGAPYRIRGTFVAHGDHLGAHAPWGYFKLR